MERVNCDSKCLAYLITCRTCELQCTSQTCDAFRKRWNNHRCCARKVNDAQVLFIEKTQALYPIKREYFRMRTLETYCPYGLNI